MILFIYNKDGIVNQTDDLTKIESYKMEALNKGYKTIESDVFPPNDKKFVGGDLVDKTRLEKIQDGIISIDTIKAEKLNEISIQAGSRIENGFISSVLGESYKYDTKLEDQFNFKNILDLGIDNTYRCLKVSTGVKTFYPHTIAQLRQVYNEFLLHTKNVLVQADIHKNAIVIMENELEIENYELTWND